MGAPRKGKPHPLTRETVPVTFGHEFCGRVVHAPPGSGFQEGQAVVADPRLYCSKCTQCSKSVTNGCNKLGFLGISGIGGGFSKFVPVKPSMLQSLPDSVNLKDAAIIEPLSVAWHAVRLVGLNSFKGVSTLILGGGPIGVAVLYVLRTWGCDQIFVSEPAKARATGLQNIADQVFNPLTEDVSCRCLELTADEGVQVVFDCAGVAAGMEDALKSLQHGGTYMTVAAWEAPVLLYCPLYGCHY
jgi:threonine dehydrogenase-like Zn-dependent dehydrogenase